MGQLISQSWTFRDDSDESARERILKTKAMENEQGFRLTRSIVKERNRKNKGEIVETWYETIIEVKYD